MAAFLNELIPLFIDISIQISLNRFYHYFQDLNSDQDDFSLHSYCGITITWLNLDKKRFLRQ